MRRTLGSLVVGALVLGVTAPAASGSAADTTGGPGATGHSFPVGCSTGLTLVLGASDEFDAALDDRWRVYDYAENGQRSRELYYRPDMVRTEQGKLSLMIVDEPGDIDGDGNPNYPAGGVESTFDVPGATIRSASCVEVRTKGFAANVAGPTAWDQNVFSAVWLQTRPLSVANNPNPEIDIQEFFETDKMHMALHTWKSPEPPASPTPAEHVAVDNCRTGRQDRTEDPPGMIDYCRTEPLDAGDLTAAMHTYGVRRDIVRIRGELSGLLTFYFDGHPVWVKELAPDSPLITQDRHLILSTQGNPPGGPGLAFPKVAEHDWVRTYH